MSNHHKERIRREIRECRKKIQEYSEYEYEMKSAEDYCKQAGNGISLLMNEQYGKVKSNCIEAMLKLPRYRKEEKEMVKKSLDLLAELGLVDLKDEKASSLPYGKQRKLEIARALATSPKLLLLDEPAAGMNPTETDELTAFVREIKEKFNLSIFMIEHHMNMVMGLSDRIQVFEYGITIAEGTPSDIQNDKKVIDAYLGVSEDD